MRNILLSSLFILITQVIYGINPLPPKQPALVLNIVVDNISDQDIEKNRHLLSNNGILRLFDEGTHYTNAYYPYSTFSKATDYATIVTGTTPRNHGIVSEQWYNRLTEEYESSISNGKYVSVGTNGPTKSFDASKMVCSTIGDELKLATNGLGKLYSVSLSPTASVLLGGHAADEAFWLDNKTGNFISSDYFSPWLPEWTDAFNNKKLADFYLTQDWTLFNDPDLYNYPISKDDNTLPLSLTNNQKEKSPYEILSITPMGNMLLTDFVLELLEQEKLGKDEISDMLYINIGDVCNNRFKISNNSHLKGDYIIRLDKEIERILEYLDKNIGKHRYLISLASTKNTGASIEELKSHNIPNGIFDPERSKALLNSYLMATYGQGNWVTSFTNQQLYLNKELIEKSNLDFQDFQDLVAEFMASFTGVKWALPAYKLKHADFNEGDFRNMQESFFTKRSGDILLIYYPGWVEKNVSNSNQNPSCSLLIYGWKVARYTDESASSITNLTSVLSTVLDISKPNGMTQKNATPSLLIK